MAARPNENEYIVPLKNGCTLHCDMDGLHIRICDSQENEILYWEHTEWECDPCSVMAAIFGATQCTLEYLLQNRVLEEGFWNYRKGK